MSLSSAFLAEFMGLYIMIVSAAFVLRHEKFVEYARSFAEDIALRYSVALVELAAGLVIILQHPVYELSYVGAITVVGWLMLIESVFHLAATEDQEHMLLDHADDRAYWKVFGTLSLLFGVYLVTHGFTVF